MNKRLMTVAVAAALALPMAANAGDAKVYGKVHVSLDNLSDSGLRIDGQSKKANSIGVKGSMDSNLHDFKVVYKIEAGMDLESTDGFHKQRDTWVGMSSKSIGTFRAGTIVTSYKGSGKMVDPLFTTTAEGRGAMGLMSDLHGGTGDNAGRATNTMRYDSPSIGGAKIIGTYTVRPSVDDNIGVGLHYKNGPVAAFFDYISFGDEELTAMKVGGKYTAGPASVALQYEIDDDGSIGTARTNKKVGTGIGGDQLFVAGTYSMGATSLIVTVGSNDENMGYALAAQQKLNKKAAAYLGYAASDDSGTDDSAITAGMVVKF